MCPPGMCPGPASLDAAATKMMCSDSCPSHEYPAGSPAAAGRSPSYERPGNRLEQVGQRRELQWQLRLERPGRQQPESARARPLGGAVQHDGLADAHLALDEQGPRPVAQAVEEPVHLGRLAFPADNRRAARHAAARPGRPASPAQSNVPSPGAAQRWQLPPLKTRPGRAARHPANAARPLSLEQHPERTPAATSQSRRSAAAPAASPPACGERPGPAPPRWPRRRPPQRRRP